MDMLHKHCKSKYLSKYVPKPTAFVGFCQPSTSLKGIFPRDQAKAKDSKSPNIHLLTR